MAKQFSSAFQDALEMVEGLPENQQENLIEIIRRRLIERRRNALAMQISDAKEEYKQGKTNKGSVDDLMKEFS